MNKRSSRKEQKSRACDQQLGGRLIYPNVIERRRPIQIHSFPFLSLEPDFVIAQTPHCSFIGQDVATENIDSLAAAYSLANSQTHGLTPGLTIRFRSTPIEWSSWILGVWGECIVTEHRGCVANVIRRDEPSLNATKC